MSMNMHNVLINLHHDIEVIVEIHDSPLLALYHTDCRETSGFVFAAH